MDVVLKKIHYNPEVFSKIVEDFEHFVACTKPEAFREDVIKIYFSIITYEIEKEFKELKKKPEIYREDYHQVETILEGADPEEELNKWLLELPFHLYILYDTVMRILWNRNCQRYTTALGDTGKA